jgi:hypothetical protein
MKNFTVDVKITLLGILLILIITIIPYASWKISRWWNYKMSYQNQVQAEIQTAIKPLEDRITKLEFHVKHLRGVE